MLKITNIETFSIPPRWLFVKISTDEGISGWGEPVLEGRVPTVEKAVAELSEHLLGRDPLHILDHWQSMYLGEFYRGCGILMSAIAGLDQALWDIKGKYHNVPVYKLLGGPIRDRIWIYTHILGDDPASVTRDALAKKKQGFTAFKTNVGYSAGYLTKPSIIDAIVHRIGSIREAIGWDVALAVDCHGRFSTGLAKVLLEELKPFRLMFLEEPICPQNSDNYAYLSRMTSIPLAAGERLYSRWDFRRLLETNALDVVQPDLSHAGGITECYRIATMAEAFDVAFAPHSPLGPLALAACLQVDACVSNFLIQEQSMNTRYNTDVNYLLEYVDNPSVFQFEDSYVRLPTEPGLGVIINEEKVRRFNNTKKHYRNPVWRLEDGTVCPW